MALRVWLPLNGTLENKGISNVTVTNNGATIDNNGKIGKCYYFNASTYIYENSYDWTNFNTSEFSLCCWYKEPSPVASGNSQIICIGTSSGWNNIRIGLLRRTSNGYPMFSVSDGTSAVQYSFTATSFTFDTWNHIAVTYNNGQMSMYINGVLNKTLTTTIIPVLNSSQHLGIGAASNGAEKLTGYLNDVRIYDHCLSPKEVKEISQGLVLHYKLDGWNGGAGENLLLNSNFSSETTNNWYGVNSSTITHAVKDGKHTGTGTKGTSANIIGQTEQSYSYIANSIINLTVSADVYVEETGTFGVGHWITTTEASGWQSMSGTRVWNSSSNTLSIGWNHISTTLKDAKNAYNGKIVTAFSYTGTTFWITNVKLELGSTATSYSQAPADLGIDTTKITDSSGYSNDGTIQGSLSTINNSARYEISTIFTGSYVDYIYRPTLNYIKKSFTISCWAYPKAYPSYRAIMVSNGGKDSVSHGVDLYINSSGIPCFMIANNNTAYYASSPNALNLNTWYLLTCTYDGTSMKLYVNGELKKTTSATIEPDYDTTPIAFVVGKMGHSYTNTGGYFAFNGYINDVRVYATDLSVEDILDLYHTPANIDNLGELHSFELKEDINGRELLALPWTSTYGTHNKTSLWTEFNENGEWTSSTNSSSGSDYIKINPTGKTYYYDAEISIASGNQFYIGFERYDASKTARSNQACVYIIAIKPSTDINHQRYFGTVNLATDGVNPTDTITLRILNAWSGTDSTSTKKATIHYLSLREVTGTPQTNKIFKNGQDFTDEFIQRDGVASIYQNGTVGASNFIEK